MTMLWTAAFAIPLLLSLAGALAMLRLAPRIGLMDAPAARKVHARPIPLGGGVAIFLAVVLPNLGVLGVAWLVVNRPELAGFVPDALRPYAPGVLAKAEILLWMLAAGAVQMTLGLADDWRRGGLDYRFRLLVEIGLVLLLATQGVSLQLFYVPHWVAVGLTVVWVVGLTNAVNFLDNMDGLAAGVVTIAAATFAVLMALVGSLFVGASFALVAGAAAGFLILNWNPARIFMGDAGSNFLGFWLGMLTVVGTFFVTPFSPVTVCAPLCVLAVPIYDSVSVVLIRLWQGRSPFQPDKQHFSHRLVMLGLSTKQAVAAIYLVCLTTGLGGMLLYFLTPASAALGAPIVVLQVGCILLVIALLEAAAHRKRVNGEDRPA